MTAVSCPLNITLLVYHDVCENSKREVSNIKMQNASLGHRVIHHDRRMAGEGRKERENGKEMDKSEGREE